MLNSTQSNSQSHSHLCALHDVKHLPNQSSTYGTMPSFCIVPLSDEMWTWTFTSSPSNVGMMNISDDFFTIHLSVCLSLSDRGVIVQWICHFSVFSTQNFSSLPMFNTKGICMLHGASLLDYILWHISLCMLPLFTGKFFLAFEFKFNPKSDSSDGQWERVQQWTIHKQSQLLMYCVIWDEHGNYQLLRYSTMWHLQETWHSCNDPS